MTRGSDVWRTAEMTQWAVTANLGGERQSDRRKDGMIGWTKRALRERRPAVFFAQESFSRWLSLFDEHDNYEVIKGVDRGWSVQSALVYRTDLKLEPLTEIDLPNLSYHGNYVAAARWHRPDERTVILASVHASPNYADTDEYGWPSAVEIPKKRDGGSDPRWPNGRSWDSDFVLITLRDMHRVLGLPLLAAGDLNESLTDDREGGTWASEYFARAREYRLFPWLHDQWSAERPTRAGLQLDHVLASEDAVAMLAADPKPEVDRCWNDAESAAGLSDHAPIWFTFASTV